MQKLTFENIASTLCAFLAFVVIVSVALFVLSPHPPEEPPCENCLPLPPGITFEKQFTDDEARRLKNIGEAWYDHNSMLECFMQEQDRKQYEEVFGPKTYQISGEDACPGNKYIELAQYKGVAGFNVYGDIDTWFCPKLPFGKHCTKYPITETVCAAENMPCVPINSFLNQ